MMIVALPKGLRIASARSRATLSVGPPAANGTTIVMGLSGNSAKAVEVKRAATAVSSKRFMADGPCCRFRHELSAGLICAPCGNYVTTGKPEDVAAPTHRL